MTAQSIPPRSALTVKMLADPANDTVRVNRLNALSAAYLQTNADSVKYFANLALLLARQLDDPNGIAGSYMNFSSYYRKIGDYAAALSYCLRALKQYEILNATGDVASAQLQVAQVYKDMGGDNFTMGFLLTAITYAKQGYLRYSHMADTPGMVLSLNVSGIIFRDLGKKLPPCYDTAFNCYQRALALIAKSGKGEEYLGRIYNNISQVYSESKGNFPLALEYLVKAVAFNEGRGNTSSLTYNYGNISDVYLKTGDQQKAVFYALKMLDISLRLNAPGRITNAYNQLHRAYQAAGKPDSALKYYVLYDHLDDSLTNISKASQITEMQTRYETEKKQAQINRLAIENSAKNRRILILGSVLILLCTLIGIMLWLYQRIKMQKRLITEQSQRLELMMKELHHRVKNNLQIVSSLLSLQAYKMHDEEAIAAMKESQQRVEAMSLIHQRLYKTDNLTQVNLKEYISDLLESLMSSYGYGPNNFELELAINQDLLDVDRALPLGLIINEVVTNAFKYAYENTAYPSLHISLSGTQNQVILSIKDNGKGLDQAVWRKKGGSFGKQLITTLCKQLRAEQQLETMSGTSFTFVIPTQAKVA